jgi:putative oxidoreductase
VSDPPGSSGEGDMMNVAYALGRIFVPIVFIWGAIQKLLDIGGFAKLLAEHQVPIPDEVTAYLGSMPKYEALAWALALLELICGIMILVGLKARWAALVLIVFTAATIFFVHPFWQMSGEAYALNQTHALKNLSILGALLLIVAAGSGPHSIDRRSPS